MRKFMVVPGLILLLCVWSSPVMAGAIINKSNLSSDYMRSLTRNAATDAADIAAYNPAGVMKMPNGIYTKLDILYLTKDYENTVPVSLGVGEDGHFESDEPSIIPGFFAVYKQDKWAGFFAVTIPGGGGEVKFDNGNAYSANLGMGLVLAGLGTGIDSHYIEANSYAVGYTLGGAYQINEKVSVAGGLRYVDSSQEYKGHVNMVGAPPGYPSRYDVDIERTATGWNGFLGVNVVPMDKLNIGFLYMSNTNLDYDSDVKEDTLEDLLPGPGNGVAANAGWADGTSRREDLPGYLGLGVSYQFTPKWRTELDYTLYLEKDAELDSASGRWDDAGNSYEVALSVEYAFNSQWKASLGYMISKMEGMDPDDMIPLAPELDANTIACGAVYTPDDRWRFNAGFANVEYDGVTNNTVGGSNSSYGTAMDKHVMAFSVGAQYRF